PANQRADTAETCVKSPESQIARREVVLLVIEWIVRNVHLAIEATQRAIGIQDDRRIMVDAGRPALEQRRDQHGTGFARHLGQPFAAGTGDRLCQIEEAGVLTLTEIGGPEELLQANDLGSRLGRLPDA